MNLSKFEELVTVLHEEADKIVALKRPSYTIGSADVLANFKRVAERAGITPLQAWAVYFLKHVDAIASLAKDPTIPQAEAIIGRFADAQNYLDLGWALYNEIVAIYKDGLQTIPLLKNIEPVSKEENARLNKEFGMNDEEKKAIDVLHESAARQRGVVSYPKGFVVGKGEHVNERWLRIDELPEGISGAVMCPGCGRAMLKPNPTMKYHHVVKSLLHGILYVFECPPKNA